MFHIAKDRIRSKLFTLIRRIPWAYTSAQRLNRLLRPGWLGISRRTLPLSKYWGYDRGLPIDRYYIERFLAKHRYDIQGSVLEVKDGVYVERFGVGVKHCEVLDIDPTNPRATIITDLTVADAIPSDHFDCFVCTQTLQYIYDMPAALAHIHRILRPGGVLLATVPCLCRVDTELICDYWRFTQSSCEKLFGDVFGASQINVTPRGNVLAAIAFLTGMACQELRQKDLDKEDERFPLIITVRAVKK